MKQYIEKNISSKYETNYISFNNKISTKKLNSKISIILGIHNIHCVCVEYAGHLGMISCISGIHKHGAGKIGIIIAQAQQCWIKVTCFFLIFYLFVKKITVKLVN